MGLYGILVVTACAARRRRPRLPGPAPALPIPVVAIPYDAEVPAALQRNRSGPEHGRQRRGQYGGLLGETRSGLVRPAGRLRQSRASGAVSAATCYPPAVNYTPLYYLINGVAFNKTNAAASLFPFHRPIAPGDGYGVVLVRLVNAGLQCTCLRSSDSQADGAQTGGATPIVTGFKLIAEDGNPLPRRPRRSRAKSSWPRARPST